MDDYDFDPNGVRDLLNDYKKPDGLLPVISNEGLAGHPLSGGFNRLAIANRINDVFGKPKVLVIIREQNALITSNYMQYLKYGGWHTPERFIHPEKDGRQPTLSLNFWDYATLMRQYQNCFGAENVLCLPYELLVASPLAFLSQIARFSGSGMVEEVEFGNQIVNKRRSHIASYYLRQLTVYRRPSSANGFMPSLLRGNVGLLAEIVAKKTLATAAPRRLDRWIEKRLAERIDRLIGDRFAASNAIAEKLCGFPLRDMGYKV